MRKLELAQIVGIVVLVGICVMRWLHIPAPWVFLFT
jgi:hypothetical protein